MKETLDVGDTVSWRGSWGYDNPVPAAVKGITVGSNTDAETSVESIDWAAVNSRDVVVDLNNGHWAYGNQISRL